MSLYQDNKSSVIHHNDTKETTKDHIDKNEQEGSNIEDALEATGFGKFHILITLTGGLILYAVNTECWSIGYIISSMGCDLNLNLQHKTILVTVGAAGIMTTQFLWGYLSDRLGRRNIMLYTLAAGCLCTILSVVAPMFWLVVLFRFLNGTFIAGAVGISFPYIGEFFSAKYSSVAILVMAIFIGLALMIIPLWAMFLIPLKFPNLFFGQPMASWRVFLLVSGLPSLVACLVLYFSPESPKFLAQALRHEEALAVLRRMHKLNKSKDTKYPVEKLIIENCENEDVRMWDIFNRQYIWKTLLVCTIQAGVFATSGGLYLWYPVILQKISQYNQEIRVCEALNLPIANTTVDNLMNCDAAIDNSVYLQNMLIGGAYTIGYVSVSALVNKLGIKMILMGFLGIAGLAMFMLHFLTQSIIIDVMFTLLLVLSGVCVAVVNAAVVEIYPTHLRGMAVSITMLSGRVATIFASSVVGYALEWNCEVTFLLFSGSLVGCSLLSLLLPTKGQTQSSAKSYIE